MRMTRSRDFKSWRYEVHSIEGLCRVSLEVHHQLGRSQGRERFNRTKVLSTRNLAALNTSCPTGFAPDTSRVPGSHVSRARSGVHTGVSSVSRPWTIVVFCPWNGLSGTKIDRTELHCIENRDSN